MLSKYKQQISPDAKPTWTRIQMLLDLYAETISELRKVDAFLEAGSQIEANGHGLKVSVLIEAIVSGIDVEHGKTPEKVLELCLYVMRAVSENDRDAIKASIDALVEIRDAFLAVKDEANALEASGEIPPLQMELAVVDSLS